jgi:hypothetical protein
VAAEDDPFKGWTPEQIQRWLKMLPDDVVKQELWKRPAVVLEAVKVLRRVATDPSTSADARAEALRDLKRYGFDEDSLRADEDEAG